MMTICKERATYLRKLSEYGDIDKEVFKLVYTVSDQYLRRDLLLFAKLSQ